jgi:5-methylcytosine-specific restriction endonuclease McrA
MRQLHIVQGGIENGDKRLLERTASSRRGVRSWIGPKHAAIGDDVVVYIGGYGFFATARVASQPKRRQDWHNRYAFDVGTIRLIEPAVSLHSIELRVPALTWAKYPRSITTPAEPIATQIRDLIRERRRTRLPDLDEDALAGANLGELRAVALLKARANVPPRIARTLQRARAQAIRLYVLQRAGGFCEGCGSVAPFLTTMGQPYLEPHHTTRLADEGPDHPAHVIALCPNCHRRAHHAHDAAAFNRSLKRQARRREAAQWRVGLKGA